ncbi:sugar ABC transporter permease [Streptomyces sp. SL13]|uniref:Sugar ABC transporter permease n=1 Tax=Streptantibioticus silvisoli TaxID=2705255 RepID=A0AA90KFP9_9ACTN|nr:sugar ABC transporter permease [Streptantibioticus silvisoli]MDI5963730.1 sugar ABC transporter permease [Streptantibioticus silvisoli]MDI5969570.1 sugar ABC transporter permease [Streptantibioticus silvisoli]
MATINLTRATARDARNAAAGDRRRMPLRRRLREHSTAYLFMAGAVLCFAVFSWYPMIREVIMSFQYTNFAGTSRWVGLENYRHVFADPSFGEAWRTTGLFTLFALVFGYAVPFLTAVVMNELRHVRSYFRLLVYLPVMMPPVAAAFLWRWFYSPDDAGLFNAVLHALHLPPVQWLQSSHTLAVLCLVLFSTWINMGGTVLVYLASLQGIPGELYEAAEVDGTGILRRIWHITIPQTRLILSMMLLLQVVGTMQVFVEPYVITASSNNTASVVYLIYQYAFNFNNYGSASALGVVLLLVLLGFSAGYLWLSRRAEED